LRHAIEGDVLADEFSRGRYATDASPFQSFPLAIALPKTQDDVLTAMRLAWEAGVPVIARGGATGRAGQSVGEGLVIDFSKYLTRLLYYDASAQTCIVEPGITPAALNTALTTERVWFPVEIGSAMQATIGGMAATDAIGSRTLLHGRMRDNITACDAVLSHGAEISFGEVPDDFAHSGGNSEETALILDLLEAAESNEAAIRALPSILGGQHGFNVPRLLSGEAPQNLAEFLAGSEGTLAVARRIELKLARMPKSRALGVCHFATLGEALRAVERILTLEPTDVELTSGRIFELGLAARDAADPARRLLRKEGGALLLVEFMHGNNVTNARKLKELGELMAGLGHPRSVSELIGPAAQEAARRAHRLGIARLYGTTHETAAFARIDQIALPLPALAHAAERLTATFGNIGMDVIWHGQIGAGAVYMRPWLRIGENTGEADAAARDAFAVLQDFKSQFAAVEGYGLARSFDAETMREPALTALFEEIKTRFLGRRSRSGGRFHCSSTGPIAWDWAMPARDTSMPPLGSGRLSVGSGRVRDRMTGLRRCGEPG
jgi:FAD/FMN-containing dehydrogenase